MSKVWKIESLASFMKVEKKILLVNFRSQKDQSRVLNGGPWTIDGGALLMQKWEQGMMGDDFSNTSINIWVQIHRLPYEL